MKNVTVKIYAITSKVSGAEVWRGEAISPEKAIWCMAMDAGYKSVADMNEASADDGSDLVVTEVNTLEIVSLFNGEERRRVSTTVEDFFVTSRSLAWGDGWGQCAIGTRAELEAVGGYQQAEGDDEWIIPMRQGYMFARVTE